MPKINVKNLIVIVIVGFVLISSNIGGLYIYALDEAKNASCAREMLEAKEWVVPTFNYELRTDKPPLHYYFMIASYSIFGINAFSARIFSVIMGVLTLLSIWFLATRYYGNRTSLYTSLVLLSSLHYVLQFHMAVPDPYLIFLLTLGFVSYYIFFAEQKPVFLLISYISFGLGMLTKGPVAILLPGIAILAFLLFTKTFNWKYFLKLKPLWILAVLIVIIAPWFIAVGVKTDGQWISDFFLRHNLERYTNTMEEHGSIFLATPLMVFIGLLPFSIYFIQSYRYGWQNRKKDPLLIYSGIISLTFIVFFAFSSTKLPNYTVPAYPFIALLTGRYLAGLQDNFRQFKKSVFASLLVYLILAVSIPIGLFVGLDLDPLLQEVRDQAFFFLIIPVGAVLALIFIYWSRYKGMLLSLSLSWVISSILFFYIVFPKVDRFNPVARLLPTLDPGRPVAAYKIYNPAFSFYIRKPIPTFMTPQGLKKYIKEEGQGYILTRKVLTPELAGIDGIEIIGEAKDIFEIPTTVIYKIRQQNTEANQAGGFLIFK